MMEESRIKRLDLTRRLERALRANPVVALIGPRQCG
jgi:predicted AAA+ superfamily ATPase